MPIYEFRCNDCNREFECLVLGRGDEVTCPDCRGAKVQRVMSACSFKSSGGSSSPAVSSGGCSSCSGKNCSSCH